MRRWLGVALLLLLPTPAMAACSSISVTPLVFGTYVSSAVSVTATVTVNCTAGFAYTIGISNGYSGNAAARLMSNAGHTSTLSYGMYQDAAYSIPWGNNNYVTTMNGVGTGSNQTFTIYGLIPASQNVAPSSYFDSMISYVYLGPSVLLSVSATVSASCTISSTSMGFGTYTGVANVNGTFTVSVTCTNTTPYNLTINYGLNQSGGSYTWRMVGPSSNYLSYKVYSNAGRTTYWGGTIGTDAVARDGHRVTQSVTGYGQIPSGQYPVPGSYSDTVQLSVTY